MSIIVDVVFTGANTLDQGAKSFRELAKSANLSAADLKKLEAQIKRMKSVGAGLKTLGTNMERAQKAMQSFGVTDPFSKIAQSGKHFASSMKEIRLELEKTRAANATLLVENSNRMEQIRDIKAAAKAQKELNAAIEKQATITMKMARLTGTGGGSTSLLGDLKNLDRAETKLRSMKAAYAEAINSSTKLTQAQKEELLVAEKLASAWGKNTATKKRVADGNNKTAASTKNLHIAMAGMARSVGVATLSWSALLPLMAGMAIGSSIKKVYALGSAFEYTTTYVDALKDSLDGISVDEIQEGLMNLEGLRKGPQELAAGMKEFAKAGVEASTSLQQIGEMSKFATIAELDLGRATKLVIGQSKAFDIEFTESANMIAAAALSSATDIEELGNALSYTTELATVTGTTFDEVATAMAIMANAGIRGSKAGTAIRTSLLKMATPTEGLRKRFDALGISWSAFTEDGKIKSMKAMFTELKRVTEALPDSQRVGILKDLFGLRALKGGANLLRAQGEEWDKLNQKIRDAATGASYIDETYQKLADTTQAKWEKLGVELEKALIKAFDSDDIKGAIESLTDFVSSGELTRGLQFGVSELTKVVTLITELGNVITTLSVKIDKAKNLREFFDLLSPGDLGGKMKAFEKEAQGYLDSKQGEELSWFGKLIQTDLLLLDALEEKAKAAASWFTTFEDPVKALDIAPTEIESLEAELQISLRATNSKPNQLAEQARKIAKIESDAARLAIDEELYHRTEEIKYEFSALAAVDQSKIFQPKFDIVDDKSTLSIDKYKDSITKLSNDALGPMEGKLAALDQWYQKYREDHGLMVVMTEEERKVLSDLNTVYDKNKQKIIESSDPYKAAITLKKAKIEADRAEAQVDMTDTAKKHYDNKLAVEAHVEALDNLSDAKKKAFANNYLKELDRRVDIEKAAADAAAFRAASVRAAAEVDKKAVAPMLAYAKASEEVGKIFKEAEHITATAGMHELAASYYDNAEAVKVWGQEQAKAYKEANKEEIKSELLTQMMEERLEALDEKSKAAFDAGILKEYKEELKAINVVIHDLKENLAQQMREMGRLSMTEMGSRKDVLGEIGEYKAKAQSVAEEMTRLNKQDPEFKEKYNTLLEKQVGLLERAKSLAEGLGTEAIKADKALVVMAKQEVIAAAGALRGHNIQQNRDRYRDAKNYLDKLTEGENDLADAKRRVNETFNAFKQHNTAAKKKSYEYAVENYNLVKALDAAGAATDKLSVAKTKLAYAEEKLKYKDSLKGGGRAAEAQESRALKQAEEKLARLGEQMSNNTSKRTIAAYKEAYAEYEKLYNRSKEGIAQTITAEQARKEKMEEVQTIAEAIIKVQEGSSDVMKEKLGGVTAAQKELNESTGWYGHIWDPITNKVIASSELIVGSLMKIKEAQTGVGHLGMRVEDGTYSNIKKDQAEGYIEVLDKTGKAERILGKKQKERADEVVKNAKIMYDAQKEVFTNIPTEELPKIKGGFELEEGAVNKILEEVQSEMERVGIEVEEMAPKVKLVFSDLEAAADDYYFAMDDNIDIVNEFASTAIDQLSLVITAQKELNAEAAKYEPSSGTYGGKRAVGGPVAGGTTYLVGEKGPELFTPSASGMIIPNDKLGSSNRDSVDLNINIGGQQMPTIEGASRPSVDSFMAEVSKVKRLAA